MSVKAFDLIPVIENGLEEDKVVSRSPIKCLECCGKNLYMGTGDSYIIHYILEERSLAGGETSFMCSKHRRRNLGLRKSVLQLKSISALSRLLCLCDGNLLVLSTFDLQILTAQSKVKGVTSFCVNENPHDANPFNVQLCIARKKQLQLYTLTDDKFISVKDISTPEPPVTMAMDGRYICVAMTTYYAIVEAEGGFVQELFPYDNLVTMPLVKRITKEEFLLNGPSALGMFVTAAGTSERPPLPWGEMVVSVAYSHPYILVLTDDFLAVYSILDQQLKQKIAFFGGCHMDNFDGKIFLASAEIICTLFPVPWEKQVEGLLAEKKVGEALELARFSNRAGMTKDHSEKVIRTIQQRAGFIEFSLFNFDEARELFQSGALDVRELIDLFKNLRASSCMFLRSNPPLHDLADVTHMCRGDPGKIASCKEFLLNYLEDVRHSPGNSRMEVETALLKLYSERHHVDLIPFVCDSLLTCERRDIEETLQGRGCYHALASFYWTKDDSEKALHIWARLLHNDLTDSEFPGLAFFIEILLKVTEHGLLFKYADIVLERDQEIGAKIFTERFSEDGPDCDSVLEFLHRFPNATLAYLENLVLVRKLQKEKLHTHLAMLYLDTVFTHNKKGETESVKEARTKLQDLLQESSCYRTHLLLGKTIEHQLHQESAILYGKLEEHEKALRILVHQLKDYQAAENYCHKMSQDRKNRHRLFHTLLGVYLDPRLESNQREIFLAPAIELLNSQNAEWDSVKVLQLLPPDWSVAILEKFLNKALRTGVHRCRTSRLQQALTRQANIQTRFSKMCAQNRVLSLTDDRTCAVCNKPFTESVFCWYPEGFITHSQCSKQIVKQSVGGRKVVGTDPGR